EQGVRAHSSNGPSGISKRTSIPPGLRSAARAGRCESTLFRAPRPGRPTQPVRDYAWRTYRRRDGRSERREDGRFMALKATQSRRRTYAAAASLRRPCVLSAAEDKALAKTR